MDVRALEQLLYHQSGLLGVSGISNDMRILLASNDPRRRRSSCSCMRRVREIGSLIAVLGGLDALVFTGGIGEHSGVIRAKICSQMAWLGLELNYSAKETDGSRISALNSKVSAWVVALPTKI